MSSNRLIYDDCAYHQKVDDSVYPLYYQLAGYKYENCDKCKLPGTNFQSELSPQAFGYRSDVEAHLRSQDLTNSKCPGLKHQARLDSCSVPSQGISSKACDRDGLLFPNNLRLPTTNGINVEDQSKLLGACDYTFGIKREYLGNCGVKPASMQVHYEHPYAKMCNMGPSTFKPMESDVCKISNRCGNN